MNLECGCPTEKLRPALFEKKSSGRCTSLSLRQVGYGSPLGPPEGAVGMPDVHVLA